MKTATAFQVEKACNWKRIETRVQRQTDGNERTKSDDDNEMTRACIKARIHLSPVAEEHV